MQPHADKLIKVKLESQSKTPSFSPWSSGMVLVSTKSTDGSIKYRLTNILRPLNAVTLPEIYPVPNMTVPNNDAITDLSHCTVFSVIDLKTSTTISPSQRRINTKQHFLSRQENTLATTNINL
jgi:hypothetical protein